MEMARSRKMKRITHVDNGYIHFVIDGYIIRIDDPYILKVAQKLKYYEDLEEIVVHTHPFGGGQPKKGKKDE